MTTRGLDEAMKLLSQLGRMDWVGLVEQPQGAPFPDLTRAVARLEKDTSRPRDDRSRIERAKAAWAAFVGGGRKVGRPDLMELCWEPSIACEPAFLSELGKHTPLRPRALRGLMSSYHEAWSPRLLQLAKLISDSLMAIERCRAPIDEWIALARELIGPEAPRRFAATCESEHTSVSSRLARLGLPGSGAFAEAAAGELALLVTAENITIEELAFALNCTFREDNQLIPEPAWGQAYARLILNDQLLNRGADRQQLIDLALKTRGLDNPCVSSAGWSPVSAPARRRVMAWLSEEHLRLFFDLIMEGQSDPQDRRSFWLAYIGSVQRSAVVVGARDYARLRPRLEEMRERGRTHARMRGVGAGNAHVSAFIMDFGKVIIVEFSKRNSACYFYSSDDGEAYLDLRRSGFEWSELKNTSAAIKYLAHVPAAPGWHDKFRGELARYGVRPR